VTDAPAPAPETAAITGWRADPHWRLVYYDPTYFTDPPPDVPIAKAELAQPDRWASLYDGSRVVATWSRA
jgi:hypothetical protein